MRFATRQRNILHTSLIEEQICGFRLLLAFRAATSSASANHPFIKCVRCACGTGPTLHAYFLVLLLCLHILNSHRYSRSRVSSTWTALPVRLVIWSIHKIFRTSTTTTATTTISAQCSSVYSTECLYILLSSLLRWSWEEKKKKNEEKIELCSIGGVDHF